MFKSALQYYYYNIIITNINYIKKKLPSENKNWIKNYNICSIKISRVIRKM